MRRFFAPLAVLALMLPVRPVAAASRPSPVLLAKATKSKPSGKKKAAKPRKGGSAWPWVLGLVVIGAAGAGYWKRRELKAFFEQNAPDAVKGFGRAIAKKAVDGASKVAGDQMQGAVGDGLGGAVAGDATELVAKEAGHRAVAPKSTLTPAPLKSKEAAAIPAAATPAAAAPVAAAPVAAKGHGYPPVHGIDLKTYARLNAERNRRAAFDDASLAPILAPHKLSPAQFLEVEKEWQHRMSDGDQPAERLRAVMDEFNRASAEAMQAA